MDCMITEKTVKNRIGRRNKEIHKGDCGRILIAAGSWGMAGAAILAARSALRAGADWSGWPFPEALFPIVQVGVPEATCIERNLSNLDLAAYDAICAGPGLGEGEESIALITKLLEEYEKTLVIDADGLNVIAHQDLFPLLLQRQKRFPLRTILTPHMGEAKRLLGDTFVDVVCGTAAGQAAVKAKLPQGQTGTTDSQSVGKQAAAVSDAKAQMFAGCAAQTDSQAAATHVQQEGALASTDRKDASAQQGLNDGAVRLRIVDALAAKTGAIVVLKGAGTLVAAPGIQAYTNTTGNPGMATGGSGDVLSGIITGLAGQRQQTAAHVQNSESADTKGCANAALFKHIAKYRCDCRGAVCARLIAYERLGRGNLRRVYPWTCGGPGSAGAGRIRRDRQRSGAVYGIRAQAHLAARSAPQESKRQQQNLF